MQESWHQNDPIIKVKYRTLMNLLIGLMVLFPIVIAQDLVLELGNVLGTSFFIIHIACLALILWHIRLLRRDKDVIATGQVTAAVFVLAGLSNLLLDARYEVMFLHYPWIGLSLATALLFSTGFWRIPVIALNVFCLLWVTLISAKVPWAEFELVEVPDGLHPPVYLAIVPVLITLYLIHSISKASNQATKLIHSHNTSLSNKNREITDSIKYAKRLQDAILPAPKLVKEYLSESFILYKPKDIVAGDFYWMESEGDEVWYAAADCTGHGVPGAMVSVVCANALNRAFSEFQLRRPSEILDKVRELVVETYSKSGDEVSDGMDVALVRHNLATGVVEYAGANNPLWLVRSSEEPPVTSTQEADVMVKTNTLKKAGVTLVEVKADKQPIGRHAHSRPFTEHHMELQKGDCLYLFSDGFADQFGGTKGKKFKYMPFKELICSIHDETMDDQKAIIDRVFEDWKGSLEQVDDVCVIGVRV